MIMAAGTSRSKEAFEDLYDRVAARLLTFVARRLQDPEAAAEMWSECWAVAFEGWATCRAGSLPEQEAWMFGIARRQLAGYYRSGAVERRAVERLGWMVAAAGASDLEEIERVAELDEMRAALRGPMAKLPSRRRQALQLRVVESLGYEEVAERMGCTEEAARAHVSRGLRALAKAIDQTAASQMKEPAV